MYIIQGIFFLNKKKESKGGQDKETAIRDLKLREAVQIFETCSLCDIGFACCFFFLFNLLIQENKVVCPACLENLINGARGRLVRDQRNSHRPRKKQQHGFATHACSCYIN